MRRITSITKFMTVSLLTIIILVLFEYILIYDRRVLINIEPSLRWKSYSFYMRHKVGYVNIVIKLVNIAIIMNTCDIRRI